MAHRMNAAAIGTAAGVLGTAEVAAQGLRDRFFGGGESTTDVASAGNGGGATASANGGAVSVGNACNAIGIGDTWGGPVGADGGSCLNTTALDITANGGTAIADASGGDYNLAFVS
jgi:hypothetical protein